VLLVGALGQRHLSDEPAKRLMSVSSRLDSVSTCHSQCCCCSIDNLHCRGEIVENTDPPLGLGVPLLLVKPPEGLATPAIFKVSQIPCCNGSEAKTVARHRWQLGLQDVACIDGSEGFSLEQEAQTSGRGDVTL
jgi:hypothetical protein